MADGGDAELYPIVPASGPCPADGMLVGEAPGQTEHYRKRPFCGKTGDVLTTYLKAAGVPRPDLRITNVMDRWPGPGNPDPTPAQIRESEPRLLAEIKRCRPRVIGAVGLHAARYFLGHDITLDTVHGIPHWSKKVPGPMILPIVHPAAGFYNPAQSAFSQEDIFRFGYYLKNKTDPGDAPKIRVVQVAAMPDEIVDAAVDTEGLEDRPWGLSWAFLIDPGTTYVFIWDGKPIKTRFNLITFQNALHDLKILRAMGVDTRQLDYGDTMVRLYNLQLEPQGLKPAAYRHLGLKMQDFDDVVRPHFSAAALDYLKRAESLTYTKAPARPIADYSKREWRIYKPQAPGRRITSIIKSWDKADFEKIWDDPDIEHPKLEKKWLDLAHVKVPGAGKIETGYCEQIECEMGEAFPDFSIFHVPRDKAVEYSGIDAAATALLEPRLEALVKAKGLEQVYEMDRRYLPFVDRMQETGMRVEVPKLAALETHLEEIREAARLKVQRIVGDKWFNPGSGDQVGRWLYRVRGIPIMKYTDGGDDGSTSIVSLKMIQGYHGKEQPDVADFAKYVREYRESDKYLGTFVRPIFEYMKRDRNGDWRIHPNFRVTRVVSGRNSSHDPNVMAFPTRTELGAMIRACFVARRGYLILSVDESQIELRTMAHLCRDPRMRDAFETGIDLHALTASIIFKVRIEDFALKEGPIAKLRKAQRYVAKTINFAVMYGISAGALLEQLYKADIFDYTMEDCQHFIDEWFKIYGSVRRFLQRVWDQAERDGYVRDMWGRMCYVPNLRVGDRRMQESARRLAGNMPVQGGARGLVKRAQIRVHDYIEDAGLQNDFFPWIDMHDELTSEVREDLVEELAADVQKFFVADQDMFRVPLKADAGWGRDWNAAK